LKIISLFSIKGGVGKTAAAVNLAYFSALRGYQTLLVDLDAQGSAEYYFRVSPSRKARGKSLLKGKKFLAALIRESDFAWLDILPAAQGLRNIDRRLDRESRKRKRLTSVLKSFDDSYDHIIVDCPPHFGLLSENVFNFSDTLLVPVIPTVLSTRTLDQLYGFFEKQGYESNKILPFFSMVDMRKRLHREMIESVNRKENFLNTMIPDSSEVERMGVTRMPLLAYNERSKAGVAFTNLGLELEERDCLGWKSNENSW